MAGDRVALRDDARRRLADQAGFLRTSLEAFFRPTPAEALRIATTIRVLVHDTPMSVALLRQVDPDYSTLEVLDSAAGWPGGVEEIVERAALWLPIPITLGGPPPTSFDLGGPRGRVALPTWWRELPAMVLGDEEAPGRRVFTREGLVKVLANQEGGAHVDPDGPPAYYERLIVERPIRVVQGGITDSRNAAYWIVAQSGAEMLEALERRYRV